VKQFPFEFPRQDTNTRAHRYLLRGRLNVSDSASDSAYASPYDYAHDLHTKGLGFEFSIIHPLQQFVNTFEEKSIPNSTAIHLWQEIVDGIVRRFVRRIARADGPKNMHAASRY
jgi:hypothetical protein